MILILRRKCSTVRVSSGRSLYVPCRRQAECLDSSFMARLFDLCQGRALCFKSVDAVQFYGKSSNRNFNPVLAIARFRSIGVNIVASQPQPAPAVRSLCGFCVKTKHRGVGNMQRACTAPRELDLLKLAFWQNFRGVAPSGNARKRRSSRRRGRR